MAIYRDDVVRAVHRELSHAGGAVFSSNGNNSRALYAIAPDSDYFQVMGSMGASVLLAAGWSRRAAVPVAVLEGDGSLAMGAAGLPMVASSARPPFMHVVLENRVYESTGGQIVPVPDGWSDHLAHGAGYDLVFQVTSIAELTSRLRDCVVGRHVGFIRVPVDPTIGDPHPRVPIHPTEITRRFRERFGDRN